MALSLAGQSAAVTRQPASSGGCVRKVRAVYEPLQRQSQPSIVSAPGATRRFADDIRALQRRVRALRCVRAQGPP